MCFLPSLLRVADTPPKSEIEKTRLAFTKANLVQIVLWGMSKNLHFFFQQIVELVKCQYIKLGEWYLL